ncbi:glycosyl transferase, WecB/TagA/CpsF family protein [Lysobacter antibioticus]|uniref:WecB/TagA/CpsF family glycosyltransferase n=1 Tax=Lysobacter antibioticus TaxID=84531 RepID=UPI0007213C9B|nr:WecB/TagA/CpsF family glycosyltransferase [Lysobacter antibioticus]ALN63833.1 glycosyl transferase, WecB/TagA/CpsF family protein [Lysobacter antibioticus]
MTDKHDSAAAMPRIRALLDRLDIVADPRRQRRLLDELRQPKRTTVLSFLNQHAFNLAWTDAAFCEDLLRSELLLRDGVGMAACLRLLVRAPGLNMNGTDLIPQLVAAYAGRRVAVAGTEQPYLERAVRHLREQGLDIVCSIDGFGGEDRCVATIAAARPELVILGMGMPRQERIAARLAGELEQPTLIVNGGAILDFMAGRFPRAPQWLRRIGLEWLYRLLKEPRRLWRRYVLGGGQFLWRVLCLAWDSGDERETLGAAALSLDTHASPRECRSMSADAEPLFAQPQQRLAGLVQRLDAQMAGGGRRIVQFIAARPGEGASSLAQAYAEASARLRKRKVLLLSDDLDRERAWPSLVEEALDRASASIAAAGDDANGDVTRARLSSAARGYQDNYAAIEDASVWGGLCERFDEIVVDAKPAFGLVAAARASGVIVVVEAEVTRASAIRKLLDDLAAVNAQVLGSILNKHRSHLPRALHDRL